MNWQRPEGMDEYLKATKLCDCDKVNLKEKAKQIIDSAEIQKEAALKIFYFVRDVILFGGDHPDVKASHTLRKGKGLCITKTNLQMALLRAVGIPARCHYVHLPKEIVKSFTLRFIYNRLPAAIGHTWCECYISGEWIACEALFDKALYNGALRKGTLTKRDMPTIDWDGETDLVLTRELILKDVGVFPSWDEALRMVDEEGLPITNRPLGWFAFFVGNWRANRIRRQ